MVPLPLACPENGLPEEDLRDDRQEPHERAQGKIAPVDQPLGEADAEDGEVEHAGRI